MIVEIKKCSNTSWFSNQMWLNIRLNVLNDRTDNNYTVVSCLHEKHRHINMTGLTIPKLDVDIIHNDKFGKMTINVGVPGSGKSTETKTLVENSNGQIKRVNRDDIRNMLDQGIYSKPNENLVTKIENQIILEALKENKHIIVDNTHLNPISIDRLKELVRMNFPNNSPEISINDSFLGVSNDVCLDRNSKRTGKERVPDDAMKRMIGLADNMRALKHTKYKPNTSLPQAFIFDVDGTLAHMGKGTSWGRSPHDYNKVGNDRVDPIVKTILDSLFRDDFKILILTGRKDSCLDLTVKWLNDNDIPYDDIFIRKSEDNRKDSIIKKEIFFRDIAPNYNILAVFDDRDQVVEMWRSIDVKCLQVEKGDF